ncbi:hypothetical protein TSUD_188090 [Trifolium subterraneum]|uniref:Uncharacterized protein n=1 Tax=Trifolium subterraneum TaxID=3900 RepID=A0A2Z6NI09_TRISU|nr:hypothetical protein TSUD_188090 [Trifolium subterraneum]
MPLPAQQQQQPQHPAQVYPKTVTNQPSPHHSNGNFGTVFIVLAIILVISVVACLLGRLCNRRSNNNNQSRQHNSLQRRPAKPNRQQQIHDFETREEDIEFGVYKRMPPPIITRPRGLAFEPPAGTRSQPHGNINNGHNNHMKDFEMKSDHESDHHRPGL